VGHGALTLDEKIDDRDLVLSSANIPAGLPMGAWYEFQADDIAATATSYFERLGKAGYVHSAEVGRLAVAGGQASKGNPQIRSANPRAVGS
jgi:hypothetical protein